MRLESGERLERYQSLWVGPSAESLLLSCPARLAWERQRGLRGLAVLPGASPESPISPGAAQAFDRLGLDFLPIPSPKLRLPSTPFASEAAGELERRELAELLAGLLHKSGASQMYLPLGAGGAPDARLCVDAGLEVFHEGASRNVFLFEERPELFLTSSVRIRLGEIGARLPPGAGELGDDAGLVRFWLGVVFAGHLKKQLGSVGERLSCARRAARAWRGARAWQPTRALGVRVQPVLQPASTPEVVELLRLVEEPVERAFGSVERATRKAARHARRHGETRGWLERYWLVLPPRAEGGVRTIAPGSESPAA